MLVVVLFMVVIQNCHSEKDPVDHPVTYMLQLKELILIAHSYSHLYNLPSTRLRFLLCMAHGEDLIWHYFYLQSQ